MAHGDRDDSFDALERGWRALPIPDYDSAGADEQAEAAAAWIAAAWRRAPVPPLRALRRRRARAAPRWLHRAAAALVAAGAIGFAGLDRGAPGPLQRLGPRADVAAEFVSPVPAASASASAHASPSVTVEIASLLLSAAGEFPGLAAFGVACAAEPIAALGGRGASDARDHLLCASLSSNQRGRWSQAAALARVVLDAGDATREQRCAALCQLAHAYLGLGDAERSATALTALSSELAYGG